VQRDDIFITTPSVVKQYGQRLSDKKLIYYQWQVL